MKLRFSEDYRTLIWALVLFPLAPTIAYARPALAPWLLPLNLYLAYCAGIFAHNHNHCSVFHGGRANAAYSAWLSVFYGAPLFTWIPTHNQNHHRYLNGPLDATSTRRRSSENSLWSAITYPFLSTLWQLPAIRDYVGQARRQHPRRWFEVRLQGAVLVVAHLAAISLAIALHGFEVGALTYALASAIPALFAPSAMMFTNYVQHVECDADSPHDHSRNFVGRISNWLAFDAGYHTVHHEHPGTHWSRYAGLHRAREAAIDPRLNESSIFSYCFKRYLLRTTGIPGPSSLSLRAADDSHFPTATPTTKEQISTV
jgi:beta-carotene hydroxylase